MKRRIKRIFSEAKEDLDLIVIMNGVAPQVDMSFFYATGITSGLFEHCSAVLHPDGSLDIISSWLEAENAKCAKANLDVFEKREERDTFLKKRVKGAKKIGINTSELTCKNLDKLKELAPKRAKYVDVSEAIVDARVVKDDEEIKNLRKSAKIASAAFEDAIDIMKPGVKEYELGAELSYLVCKNGAPSVSFETIVAFGANTAKPHYTPQNKKLKKGDFIVLDFGARYKMYCSDITRTLVMGKATSRQKKMYNTVLEANRMAIKNTKSGAKGKALYEATKEFIDNEGYKDKFIHGLGHSLGLATHDGKGLNASMDFRLKKNMVFTIEPGIYIPGFGGVRIEDDVVVKKDGCEVLTKAEKELIEL